MSSQVRELVVGDRFCFNSDSIPSVDLDCESAYGIAFGTWPNGDKWQCINCKNSESDHLKWLANAKDSEPHVDAKFPVNNYFPSPRVHTIARHRREMLDSMKDVPEYAYELSLRDLVELPRIAIPGQESPARERMSNANSKVKRGRSTKFEVKGFFLKIFFPIPSSSRRSNRCSRSSSESIRSTTTLMKDGGNPNAGKDVGSEWLENQKLAILNRDPSRYTNLTAHILQLKFPRVIIHVAQTTKIGYPHP